MTILTEKENIAKNYALALKAKKVREGLYETADKKIKITYAAGHLYNLYDIDDYNPVYKIWANGKLPYIPQEYRFKAIRAKAKFRENCEKILKDAVKNHDEIVIATDPDREGEVIAGIILEKCGIKRNDCYRIWNCEGVNEEEVIKGIKERKKESEYENIYLQGLFRKKADWLLGENLTRAYTLLNNNGVWSVGRVQTATLEELYTRQISIMLFLKRKYYEIEIETKEGQKFYYDESVSGKRIENKEEIEKVKEKIKTIKQIKINKTEEKKEEIKPPQLHESSTLQAESFEVYNIDVAKTLEISQRLYNERGVISYPRTDSRYLKEEDSKGIKTKAEELFKENKINKYNLNAYNEENKRIYDSKKIKGHHAIIPNRLKGNLTDEEKKVYVLVLNRFLMQGMSDYIKLNKKGYAEINGIKIYCRGTKELQKGWKELDLHKENEKEKADFEQDSIFNIKEINVIEKETKPPKYYTQSTILKWMKNPDNEKDESKIVSIGTQATQTAIIKTLIDREYIIKKGGHLEVTDKGFSLMEQIKENMSLYKNITVKATQEWEKKSETDPKGFLNEITKATIDAVRQMEEKLETVTKKTVIGKCPFCQSDFVEGRNGFYCEGKSKGCENSLAKKIMGKEITGEYVKKLFETKSGDVMEGVKKDGEKTKFSFRLDENGKIILTFIDSGLKICDCPKCSGEIKSFPKTYKCTSCDFFLWKESSGIKYTKEMVTSLCKGEKVRAVKTKKEGNKCDVILSLDENREKIVLEYD